MAQVKWTEILSFFNIRKWIKNNSLLPVEEQVTLKSEMSYKSKVKFHGTNGGIRILDGKVIPQSRDSLIVKDSDNNGFGTFVKSVEKYLLSLNLPNDCTIFGEYACGNIQKGVALADIKTKHFFIFAIVKDDQIIFEPSELEKMFPNLPSVMKIIPWNSCVTIDWLNSDETLGAIADGISRDVLAIEKEDPYVKEVFGISGTGEGLVFYPDTSSYSEFCNYVFKAKGEKHKNIATAKPASVNAESAKSIDEFVSLVLTPARLNQGKSKFVLPSIKNTGEFVLWMVNDVKKECSAELEASNLTFKDVENKVKEVSRKWFIEEMKHD